MLIFISHCILKGGIIWNLQSHRNQSKKNYRSRIIVCFDENTLRLIWIHNWPNVNNKKLNIVCYIQIKIHIFHCNVFISWLCNGVCVLIIQYSMIIALSVHVHVLSSNMLAIMNVHAFCTCYCLSCIYTYMYVFECLRWTILTNRTFSDFPIIHTGVFTPGSWICPTYFM